MWSPLSIFISRGFSDLTMVGWRLLTVDIRRVKALIWHHASSHAEGAPHLQLVREAKNVGFKDN